MQPPPGGVGWGWGPHLFASLLLLDVVATVALIIISYYLYRAYRVSSSQLVLFFLLGFAILAAGEGLRIVLLTIALASSIPILLIFFLAHVVGFVPQLFQTLALLMVAAGYALELAQLRSRSKVASIVPLLPLLHLQLEWGELYIWGDLYMTFTYANLALLIFILFNAVSVHLSSRTRPTLFTLVAFLLLFISNLLLLPLPAVGVVGGVDVVVVVGESLFLASKAVYLFGLLSFLALAIEVARAR